jgi:hypothetical protein
MFPKEGDAPGSDAANAPRPNEAKRLLTASVDGSPYGVRIYDAAGSPSDALASYDAAMPALGWHAMDAVGRELEKKGRAGRAFERDGVDLMIFAEPDQHGTRSIVSVVEMPPR